MEDYTQIRYDDIQEGILFKYKHMTPVEIIGLATRNVSFSSVSFESTDIESMVKLCLDKILWSKDGGTNWTPLIDANGVAKLPELDSNPQIGMDLFYRFRSDVLSPVFIESKTFQSYTSPQKDKKQSK